MYINLKIYQRNERTFFTWKIFREINSKLKMRFLEGTPFTQYGNYGVLVSHFFGKNFVKATVFLNKSLKSWFDEIFFQWDQIFHFSTVHCVSQCGKMRNSLPRKFFSSNQFTAKFCSKTLISRKIRTEHFCSLKKSWSVSNFFSDDLESCNRRKFRESIS